MPLPLALLVGLLLGLGLAWLARVELARSEVPLVLARPFLIALGFGLVVYAPVVGYAVALHGDWAYLYLIRFARVPSAVDLFLVLLAASTVPLGFALGVPWALAKRGPALLKLGAVIAIVLVAATIVAARRLAVSASFAQYHGAFGGAPIAQTPLGRGVLLSWLAVFAGYAWAARVLIRRVL